MLGFGQHFLQALTITCTLDRHAQVAADPLQQLFIPFLQGAQEAQLDHPVDLPVFGRRHQQCAARQAAAQPGTEAIEIFGQFLQAQQAAFADRLGQQAMVVRLDLLAGLLFGTQAITGHTHQPAMLVAHVHGAHHAAQIRGKEAQDVLAKHGQGQLPEHLLRQLGLAVA
ncbi:hypothetical protein D3C79_493310 [compost metagenome]